MTERIILIGYMGAGKTTIGCPLAKMLGYDFCDLDQYIEQKTRQSIAQLFAQHGEEWFRQTERDMLHEVCQKEAVVIAVGGGTPCFFDNLLYMNQHATTIYLKATIDTLITHIHISTRLHGNLRPLLQGKTEEQMRQFIDENLQKREPYYQKAQLVFPIDTLTTEEQIQVTAKKISQIL